MFLIIDLDGIDLILIFVVGILELGGLNWYFLIIFLWRIFELYEVVGCDIMELVLIKDLVVFEFIVVKLVYKFIGY